MAHLRKVCLLLSKVVVVLLLLGNMDPVLLAAATEKTTDMFEVNKKLGRGVNIIGYDPIWKSRDQARFKEKYFKMIKEAGFDTVRINLHPFGSMDEEKDLTVADSWWEVLNWAMQNALKNNLMVILDMHEFYALGNDPEANKPKLLAFWRQASERLKDAPDEVVFEILNEPCRKLEPEMWNEYLKEALALIRKHNPTRTVIIGPAHFNSISDLEHLVLPEDDRNIIVTIHFYEPMEFTHQGAPWVRRELKVGVEWKGADEEKTAITEKFDIAQEWSKKHQRPLFLGEFGVYDKAGMESRVRYLSFVTTEMEKRGWSWAYWQFDSDFILYDIDKEEWNTPVRDALLRKK
ncbi:MAG: glycoside hydrolase family 5 protein [Sedimentisphaerales bacterium]|nr:glycoside hydrolase family 5 protein [Sedimentisphaerales bacterium]